jgi:hypothetical protein
MKLLPYDSFQIDTMDSIELVHQRLSKTIVPRSWWRWRYPSEARYEGVFLDDTFQVSRIINYRNDLRPNIQGRLQALPHGGTTISIKLSLSPVTIGFLCTFYLFWYSMALSSRSFSIPTSSSFMTPHLLMPILIGISFWFAFWYEVKYSRAELTRIILGDRTKS